MLESEPERSGPSRLPLLLLPILPLFLFALLAACAPDLANPPREATATARAALPATSTAPPLELPVPTATGAALPESVVEQASQQHPTVTFWVNKTSPQYEAALEAMIANFTAGHDIHVELVTVAPDLLPELVETAATTTTYNLPDLMLVPLEYTVGWAANGLLDPGAAMEVLETLGPDTFDQTALDLVLVDGEVVALPSDGWQQLLLYRTDWFAEKELPPPDSFETILTAADVISDQENLIYSFNMPTESSLRATTRTFEQLAIANGCQLIDAQGELHILDPVCEDTLEFYRFLCNSYCPPGVQTEVSALNAYLAGRTGMIMASPAVLPAVAGLDEDYRPTCPECEPSEFLAANTGLITTLEGRSEEATPQNLGDITYLGITPTAGEAARTFARYWFEEGYLEWLAVEPARKVPMRRGTPAAPRRFIDAWYELPLTAGGAPLVAYFGEDSADLLSTEVVNGERWGYAAGEGALMTAVYEDLTVSILLQEMLSGYYDSNLAAIEGYKRLVELIPNYEYYVDPEPTPENE